MAPKTLIVIAVAFIVFVAILALLSNSSTDSLSLSDKIAHIKLEGAITSQDAVIPTAQARPRSVVQLLGKAERDPTVKAVLLEINSPGGSPVASDEIAVQIESMKKPVVSWISDVGASGAYWVAASTDKIVTHPLSITCSIGAFTTVGEFSEFFNDHGLNFTIIKSGDRKAVGNMYEPLSELDKAILQEMIDEVHKSFVEHVAENRNMSVSTVTRLADGSPCLGKKALELGLVDAVGPRSSAIELIEELVGAENLELVTLEEPGSFLSSVFGEEMRAAFYALGIGIGEGLSEIKTVNSIEIR